MTDEQIKDIIIALIGRGLVHSGNSNKELGEEMVELYIAIRKGIDEYYK